MAKTMIVSSSVNSAATTSTYAARVGMKRVICIPKNTDVEKISQAVDHGAWVVREENEKNVRCVVVPIRNYQGN